MVSVNEGRLSLLLVACEFDIPCESCPAWKKCGDVISDTCAKVIKEWLVEEEGDNYD